MKKSLKRQLNTRVSVPYSDALKRIDELIGFSQQQVVEDALAVLFGSKDDMVLRRREMLLDAVKRGVIQRPFEFGVVA